MGSGTPASAFQKWALLLRPLLCRPRASLPSLRPGGSEPCTGQAASPSPLQPGPFPQGSCSQGTALLSRCSEWPLLTPPLSRASRWSRPDAASLNVGAGHPPHIPGARPPSSSDERRVMRPHSPRTVSFNNRDPRGDPRGPPAPCKGQRLWEAACLLPLPGHRPRATSQLSGARVGLAPGDGEGDPRHGGKETAV